MDEAHALAIFERKSKNPIRRIFQRSPAKPRKPVTELVWVPFYIIPIHVESSQGPGVITVSVEAYSGAFAIFQMQPDIEDAALAEQSFAPRLSAEEAIAIGRKELLHTILRQRSTGPKPEIVSTDESYVLHYPFWLYYYERRRGLLDVKLLDAATGAKGGGKTKRGILDALADVAGGAPES